MILLIDSSNIDQHTRLFDDIYRFRHRFFVDHLGWRALRKPDGREIDAFDDEHCIHLVGVERDRVISYSRLLPTTRPHLLSHVYPEMLQGMPSLTGPTVWEWTRCAVDPARREGATGADPATAELLLGVTEACLHLGITALLVQTHPLLLTRMIELGWRARPMALPTEHDGQPVVPIHAEVDEDTLATSRAVFGMNRPVLDLPPGLGRDRADAPLRRVGHA
ncbi:MAG TPA: acyl-homoserine-lactone synthase [Salinarimonas sp.]|jgi:acyl-homoserine lactone synthase|nr:acyl-homoserine-lactone synthase [Salinarimonas sp.]